MRFHTPETGRGVVAVRILQLRFLLHCPQQLHT